MTPHDFLKKWRNVELKERSASQSHFNDLCALLGILDPVSSDPKGEWFTFEKGANKTSGGNGWADVWRRECFGWEYKGRHANLDKAYSQLLQYSVALENPPLLIVSDMNRIVIRTNWTNSVQETHEIALDDLTDGAARDRLKAAFLDPEQFKPAKSRQDLTEETAREFVGIAQRLRDRGHEPHRVAHFVIQLVFCMFAEDVGLLPDKLFTKMLTASRVRPERFERNASKLFGAMAVGGDIDFTPIEWFNGGLFTDDSVLPLSGEDIEQLLSAARRDWSQIDPSILGALFERGLDPAKRSQLGAHYTDRDKIMMIVRPVIVEPLEVEWGEALARISALVESAPKRTAERLLTPAERRRAARVMTAAAAIQSAFIERLAEFRVLDPACGSGNFLYVALKALKDFEHRANLDAETLGLPRGFPRVGPECVLGIEINSYAAELARVSVWIGEIQWMRRNGFDVARNPILRPLNTIECRDALLDDDGSESAWPAADVIIGNPPFLGAKMMKRSLGVAETEALRETFVRRLPGFTDLVCYWFEKARAQIADGLTKRVGLVATSSIAKNTNLPVLYRIGETATFFAAWPDEAWVVDGAAVRVALVCFQGRAEPITSIVINGQPVEHINPDLTTGLAVSALPKIAQNRGLGFVGVQKSGPFDIPGDVARDWLTRPLNPNGRPNSDVLRPTWNGRDITTARRDIWFIDFPRGLSESEASLWEAPFEYLSHAPYDPDDPSSPLLSEVRSRARDVHPRREWWTTYWPRPEVRSQLRQLGRYIATPMTSEHRIFLWLQLPTLPDNNLVIVARDDDTHFGILHSFAHEAWSTRIGNKMGAGNQRRYNREAIYDTFPFPEGLTPDIPAAGYAANPHAQAIAIAAARLNELRDNWLDPADLVVRVPEVVPGYPNRVLPKDGDAAQELRKRTLTNLYNARPQWLAKAHASLDVAVADAYGWGDDWRTGRLDEEGVLARLFALNKARSS